VVVYTTPQWLDGVTLIPQRFVALDSDLTSFELRSQFDRFRERSDVYLSFSCLIA